MTGDFARGNCLEVTLTLFGVARTRMVVARKNLGTTELGGTQQGKRDGDTRRQGSASRNKIADTVMVDTTRKMM